MRREWVAKRANDPVKTQMYYAKQGIATEEMQYVAQVENLDVKLVVSEVARGRMIIPANINHLHQIPMAIGIAGRCKINANIGASSLASDKNEEAAKVQICLKYGADTIMDLSTGCDLDEIRERVIECSTVPVGTVPMYQIVAECGGDIQNLTVETMLGVIEKQAKQGRLFRLRCR